MRKRILITIIVGVVGLGVTQLIPVLAAEGQDAQSNDDKTTADISDLRKERSEESHRERINNLAKEHNIPLQGKDLETIQKELKDVLILEKANELGISTDGKSTNALIADLKDVYGDEKAAKNEKNRLYENINDLRVNRSIDRKGQLMEKAKELGIQTTGKNSETIQQAILEKMVTTKAQEMGIAIDGKSLEALMEELKKVRGK